MKILVTGAAGFIGFHLCKLLIKDGHFVTGIDNINDYYDVKLKFDRLKELGIPFSEAKKYNKVYESKNFKFIRTNLEDKLSLESIFKEENFNVVCNLAAQAGVRYSLTNPEEYINSNINGFLSILECCRKFDIKHLVYASSSSVYGLNKQIPFSENHKVDTPISLYAATKKSNELMAHTYSHLFDMSTTGLRFFTVYGPWGRPDMALFLFTKAITEKKSIDIYNYGNMQRDFTYIDDIVNGVNKILTDLNPKKYSIYNIGNNNSVELLYFIDCIEKNLGLKAIRNLLPIQPGDVSKTWANVDNLIKNYNYTPKTKVEDGIKEFIKWYKNYYNIGK